MQAIDRAHRIGQTKEVIVYRFVTEGSVEEKIVERAARKLKMDHMIMQKGQFGSESVKSNAKASNGEMANMIKYGAQKLMTSCVADDDEELEADIDEILKNSLLKTNMINKELIGLE